jgi:hypothetical protein
MDDGLWSLTRFHACRRYSRQKGNIYLRCDTEYKVRSSQVLNLSRLNTGGAFKNEVRGFLECKDRHYSNSRSHDRGEFATKDNLRISRDEIPKRGVAERNSEVS